LKFCGDHIDHAIPEQQSAAKKVSLAWVVREAAEQHMRGKIASVRET